MTQREKFEAWFERYKHITSAESEIVAWAAWQESPKHRPSDSSKITKDQINAYHPETLVDRLNGVYKYVDYPPTKIGQEAAMEITRLNSMIADLEERIADMNGDTK